MWVVVAIVCGSMILLALGVLAAMDSRPDLWHPDRKKYPL